MIKDEALLAYADLLEANGFSIYEPKSGGYFVYSRVVDGRECFGSVQTNGYRTELFRAYPHTMPIRPSQAHGSSMFVDGVADELTLEAAEAVARPTNYNKLVGTQQNYRDDYWLERLYVKRGAE